MTDPAKVRRHAERVRELVASVVRTQIKDPRLGMITITDARITGDLREATVFYTVLGDAAEQAATAAALESAKGCCAARSARRSGCGTRRRSPSSWTTCRSTSSTSTTCWPRRGSATPRCSGWPPGQQYAGDAQPVQGWTTRTTRRGRRASDVGAARGPGGRRVPPVARRRQSPTAAEWAGGRRGGPRRCARDRRRGPAGLPRQPGRRRAGQHARLRARAAPARRRPGCRRPSRGRSRCRSRSARCPASTCWCRRREAYAGAGPAADLRRGQRVAAGRARRPAADGAGPRWCSTTTPPTPASAASTWSTPAAAATSVVAERAARPARRAARRGDRRVPLRRAGDRHRLVPLRHDHAGGARDGRPADRDRASGRARSPGGSSTPGRSARCSSSATCWAGRGSSRRRPAGAAWCGPTRRWTTWRGTASSRTCWSR